MSFSFNEFLELVKRLSAKEKQLLKTFLNKETNTIYKPNQTKAHTANNKDTDRQWLLPKDKGYKLEVSDFSFLETQELLKNCKASFSEEVVAERTKLM